MFSIQRWTGQLTHLGRMRWQQSLIWGGEEIFLKQLLPLVLWLGLLLHGCVFPMCRETSWALVIQDESGSTIRMLQLDFCNEAWWLAKIFRLQKGQEKILGLRSKFPNQFFFFMETADNPEQSHTKMSFSSILDGLKSTLWFHTTASEAKEENPSKWQTQASFLLADSCWLPPRAHSHQL